MKTYKVIEPILYKNERYEPESTIELTDADAKQPLELGAITAGKKPAESAPASKAGKKPAESAPASKAGKKPAESAPSADLSGNAAAEPAV